MSTKLISSIAGIILIGTLVLSGCSTPSQKNATSEAPAPIASREIPPEKILSGGPPKDGIPSIDNPKFVSIGEAGKYLKENDLGISIFFGGVARFYPNRILVWHEIVNDMVGKQPALITYCPLCGTGIVFEPFVKGKRTEFGTSGKLYNSNLVMYDRQTDSLWSQILGEAITGEMKGVKLKLLPYDNIRWRDWKKSFPNGEVLSRKTGFPRDYNKSPYGDYDTNDEIFFPVDNSNDRYHPKTPLFGLEIKGEYRAYPMPELEKATTPFTENFAGTQIRIEFHKENKTARFTKVKTGEAIIPFYGFWFSWYAVHPDTEVFPDSLEETDKRGFGSRGFPNQSEQREGGRILDLKQSAERRGELVGETVGFPKKKEKPEVGFLAPDFTLKDFNDREVRLSDFRGKQAVMLNFWAGWCPFCLAEMPAMAIIEEAYKGRLAVVAVNRGEKKENAKHFTDALNLSNAYTILLNPADDIFSKYGGFAMPSTFFIDKEGIIRDAHFGPLNSKQMKEKIQLKLGL